MTAQVEYSRRELLLGDDIAEPLVVGGVRCHGGFDPDGRYVSPRMRHRGPAIEAWAEQHRRQAGRDLLDVPSGSWPQHSPSLAQTRFLLEHGVVEPLIALLTRIGTAEGFGADIRTLHLGDVQRHFEDSVAGTATSHLAKGLFEAHGRDEAGWRNEAGHMQMWFAAREIAFEGRRVPQDPTLPLMGLDEERARAERERAAPADVDPEFERVVRLMARLLFVELSAYRMFEWAEAWLGDSSLVAGDGAAARLVRYIRADEAPHVAYLRTALSEMRDRTWVGASGARHAGDDVVGRIWDDALSASLAKSRTYASQVVVPEVEHWCRQRPDGDSLVAEFHALEHRSADAAVIPLASSEASG